MKNMDMLEKLRNKNINSGNFPTIEMLKEAIQFQIESKSEIDYDSINNTFVVKYLTPYPVRDDGGSIDSVGFSEEVTVVTFQQAYNNWLTMKAVLESKDIEAVAPTPWLMPRAERGADFDIDCELPF